MKKKIVIEIDCYETYCGNCNYLNSGSPNNGLSAYCTLFWGEKLQLDQKGWMLRIPECLAAEALTNKKE